MPQGFLLGMGTFFLSVVPGGPALLWLPAALWLNANGSTGWAIFLGAWRPMHGSRTWLRST